MKIDLNNKNALVCGSTQGIGKAAAIALAQSGANVTLVARNESSLQTVVGELAATSDQKHSFVVADFQDPAGLAEKIHADLVGRTIHVLINNTGGPCLLYTSPSPRDS